MAAALGDIIRITDRQVGIGGQVLNVYFYRVTNITGIAGDYLTIIAEWFVPNVVDMVRFLQDTSLEHTSLYLENISNGIDILEYAEGFPLAGTSGWANPMPPYVSAGFQLLRESRATRSGYKRVGGIAENDVTNGVWSGDPEFVADVEEAFAADVVIGLVTALEPVILKRPFEVPLVDPVYASIGGAVFKPNVGTQNTRKFGRGA